MSSQSLKNFKLFSRVKRKFGERVFNWIGSYPLKPESKGCREIELRGAIALFDIPQVSGVYSTLVFLSDAILWCSKLPKNSKGIFIDLSCVTHRDERLRGGYVTFNLCFSTCVQCFDSC